MAGTRRVAAAACLLLTLAACGGAPGDAGGRGSGATWQRVADSPLSARRAAVGAWVDGRFLVAGGFDAWCPPNAACVMDEPLRDGALFNPVTGRWSSIAPVPAGVALHEAVVADGVVYVLGIDMGAGAGPSPARGTVVAYHVAEDRWASLPDPPGEPSRLVAADGVLVAVAGSDELTPAVDSVFDPASPAWTVLPDDPLGPSFDRDAVWLGDRLLLAAKDLVASPGSERPALVRLAVLDRRWGTWQTLPDSELIGWDATVVGEHVVWPNLGSADGGDVNGWDRSYPFGGVLDPADGSWRDLPDVAETHSQGQMPTATVGHRIVVGEGLLDPASLEWTALPEAPRDDVVEQVVIGSDDALLVWGGSGPDDVLAEGYLIRPSAPAPVRGGHRP